MPRFRGLAFSPTGRFRGGWRVRGGRAFFNTSNDIQRRTRQGPRKAQVGFLEGPTYPTGKKVAWIAYIQNYGAPNARFPIPARPFMNKAAEVSRGRISALLRTSLTGRNPVIGQGLARRCAEVLKGEIKRQITIWRDPPNSPATIRRKGGSSNPLIASGKMRDSVSYEIKG